MFSKILTVLASATLIAAATAPAYAAITNNGGGTNGLSTNGITPNGYSGNGTGPNGIVANGLSTQGTSNNGAATGSSLLAIDAIELPAAMR